MTSGLFVVTVIVPAVSPVVNPATVIVALLLVNEFVALYTADTETPNGAAVKVTMLVPFEFGFKVPE